VIIATGTHWTAAPALPAALAEDQRCGLARRTGHVNGPTITTGPPLIQGGGQTATTSLFSVPRKENGMRNPNRLGTAGGKLTAVLGTATLTSAAGGPAGAMRFLARRRAGAESACELLP
jgi:hypothetical protein